MATSPRAGSLFEEDIADARLGLLLVECRADDAPLVALEPRQAGL